MDPRQRTENAVRKQLAAMGIEHVEVGLRHPNRGMIIRNWTHEEALNAVSWLRHMNAAGHDIYVRPAHSIGVLLLDDLDQEAVKQLALNGLAPAVVTCTSPNHFQCWSRLVNNHQARPIDTALIRAVALELASEYDADKNSADWRHFGRLAGFTNRKPCHRVKGRSPFVLLEQATGSVALNGRKHLVDAQRTLRQAASNRREDSPKSVSVKGTTGGYKPRLEKLLLVNAGKSWIDHPDWSRIDFMIARDMLKEGVPSQVISLALLADSPSLSQRKGRNAQAYVARTVRAVCNSFIPPDHPTPTLDDSNQVDYTTGS